MRSNRSATRELRILMVINGSVHGYSGGGLHAVAVLNEWSKAHYTEAFLPAGSSAELAHLVDPRVVARSITRSGPMLSHARLVLEYLRRTLTAVAYVLRRRHWDVAVGCTHFLFDLVPLLFLVRTPFRGLYWHHHVTQAAGRPPWLRWLITASERLTIVLLKRSQFVIL